LDQCRSFDHPSATLQKSLTKHADNYEQQDFQSLFSPLLVRHKDKVAPKKAPAQDIYADAKD
jgi:hypothetical protein